MCQIAIFGNRGKIENCLEWW